MKIHVHFHDADFRVKNNRKVSFGRVLSEIQEVISELQKRKSEWNSVKDSETEMKNFLRKLESSRKVALDNLLGSGNAIFDLQMGIESGFK